VRVGHQRLLEGVEVDVAVRILGDRDHVGDGFPPRQLVRVVLVGADEHHRPLVRRDLAAQVVVLVELRRQAQSESMHELVDRPRGPGTGEEHHVLVAGPEDLTDDPAGILAEAGALAPGPGGLRVRVGVQREDDLAQVVLDEPQGSPGGGVVGVDHAPRPERGVDGLGVADDRSAYRRDQGLAFRG